MRIFPLQVSCRDCEIGARETGKGSEREKCGEAAACELVLGETGIGKWCICNLLEALTNGILAVLILRKGASSDQQQLSCLDFQKQFTDVLIECIDVRYRL